MTNKIYPDRKSGEEVIIDWENQDFLFACCDCHSVHRLQFRIEGKNLIMQVWGERRRTSALRRHRGVPIRKEQMK